MSNRQSGSLSGSRGGDGGLSGTQELLKRTFDHFDTDHSGSIDLEELQQAMTALSMKCTKSQAERILSFIDNDQNGTVEFSEFVKFAADASDSDALENLLADANKRFFHYRASVPEAGFCKIYPVPPSQKVLYTKEQAHSDSITSCHSMGEGRFCTSSIDGDVLLWKWDGEMLTELDAEIQHQQNGNTLAVEIMMPISNNTRIATATDESVYLWDATKENKLSNNDQLAELAMPGIISMDSRGSNELVCGAMHGSVSILNAETMQVSGEIFECHKHASVDYRVNSVSCSKDLIATGASDGQALVFDPRILGQKDGQGKYTLKLDEAGCSYPVNMVLWTPDGKHLLVAGDDYALKMFDIRMGTECVASFLGHTNSVNTIALSPDGQRLITGAQDGGVRTWLTHEMSTVTDNYNNAKKNKDSMAPEDFNRVKSIWRERNSLNCVQAVGDYCIGHGCHAVPRMGIVWPHEDYAFATDRSGNVAVLSCAGLKGYGDIDLWDEGSNHGND